MNEFKALNNAVFGGTIFLLISGLLKDAPGLETRPISLWLFVIFFFLLRMKIFWDNQQYFGKTETKNINFKIGTIVGFISWMIWAVAAWSINNLREAYFYVGLAISISMVWIIIDALRKGACREQYFWIISNIIIIMLLWGLYRKKAPIDDAFTWLMLGLAIVIVIIDFFVSNSIPELDK